MKKIIAILIAISFSINGLMAHWHRGGGLGWYGGGYGWRGLGLYGYFGPNYWPLINPLLNPYYYNPYSFYRNRPNVIVIKG